jgi:hypothetical protein
MKIQIFVCVEVKRGGGKRGGGNKGRSDLAVQSGISSFNVDVFHDNSRRTRFF